MYSYMGDKVDDVYRYGDRVKCELQVGWCKMQVETAICELKFAGCELKQCLACKSASCIKKL